MTKLEDITVSLRAAVMARDLLGMVGHKDKNVVLIIISRVMSQLEALERSLKDDK